MATKRKKKESNFFVLWSDSLSLLLVFFIVLFSISTVTEQSIVVLFEEEDTNQKEVSMTLNQEEMYMLQNFNRIKEVLDNVILNLNYIKKVKFKKEFDKDEFDLKMKELEMVLNTMRGPNQGIDKEEGIGDQKNLFTAIKDPSIAKAIKNMMAKTLYQQTLENKIKKFGWSEKVKIKITNKYIDLEILQHSLFQYESLKLGNDSKEFLKEFSMLLKKIPGQIIIEGHTDNIPMKNLKFIKSNWEFSGLRAATVVRFLEQQGVDPNRLILQGHSQYMPVASNLTAQGRQKNRRIVIKMKVEVQ